MIEHRLELSRTPAEVWKWLLAPGKLARWLCLKAVVEPQVGGRYELFWDLERPEVNSTLGCKVLELEPARRLVVSWAGNEEQLEFMKTGSTTVAFSLEPTDSGCCLKIEHYGFGDCDRWLKAERWFDTAWKNVLKRLRDAITQSHPKSGG
ncbi:MAG TPA: SRPBCC domain-containing protein [Candidatus Coatesbacteria bacterium]|nr:SRPBCC domain-containing protein [Candidatus Coatesbacteria bacterium]